MGGGECFSSRGSVESVNTGGYPYVGSEVSE